MVETVIILKDNFKVTEHALTILNNNKSFLTLFFLLMGYSLWGISLLKVETKKWNITIFC